MTATSLQKVVTVDQPLSLYIYWLFYPLGHPVKQILALLQKGTLKHREVK